MAVMVKLRLDPEGASIEAVQALPGMAGLQLDPRFGLVCIDPAERLFVVRTRSIDRFQERKQVSPEIIEAYGDVRISGTE